MCGIVAASANRNVGDILISGLHALEYRGYDSAGLVYLQDGRLHKYRCEGKLANLEEVMDKRSILEAYGHSVMSVTDPYQALKELRRAPGNYDVVVTDYSMPGLTGLDLVDAVKDAAPGVGIVLSSGYNLSDPEEDSGIVHLAKPFTTAQLASTVMRAKTLGGAGQED